MSQQQGYIALIALLIVAAAGIAIGLSVSLAGLDQIQASYGASQAVRARGLASACLEDGLLRLRQDWADYNGGLSIGADSCILTATVNGNSATVTAIGTVDIYSHQIEVSVGSDLSVSRWQEL